MKKIVGMAVVLGLAGTTAFGAMLNQGTRELGVAGNWDRDSVAGQVSFGQFIVDGLILGVGVSGAYNDMGNDIDARSFGGDVFAQYHLDLGSPMVPFAGLAGGIRYSKIEAGDLGSDSETGWIGEGQLGVKTFIADNIAIALYGFYDLSNKEVYTNKDEMEKYDFGLRIGMNSYF